MHYFKEMHITHLFKIPNVNRSRISVSVGLRIIISLNGPSLRAPQSVKVEGLKVMVGQTVSYTEMNKYITRVER